MPRAIFRAAALAVFLVACSDGGSEPRTEVVVSPATQSRVAGETQQYTATVNGAAATAGQVTWSSSNTSVATVNASTGLATAVGAGTTKIRATVGGDYDEADLTVIANTAPTVVANADLDVSAGTTVSLTSTGTDAESQAITYRWTQTAGTDVTAGAGFLTGQNPTFTAPSSVGVLRFSVTATDAVGASGAADEVVVWVLEDAAKAVWVRPTGDDAAAGTRAAPFKTLSKALTQAMNNGGWDVYLGEGVYAEAVTVRDDVSMYGGWATDFGARYPTSDAAHRSTIRAAGTALVGTAVTDLTLNGLDIEALAPVTDRSTYGIRLHSAQRVVISSNRITSAAGAPGSAGGPGGNGTQGFNGGNSPGLVTPGNGGGNGGMGGRGATESAPALPGAPGAGGTGAGGVGGPGGLPATSSSAAGTGVNGANGAFGSTGSGGADFGFVGGTGYVPAGGGSGGQGGQGGGGGGGGGGRNVTIVFVNYHGGGGGGGGGGGFGGGGGGGGSGGGGSFGIVLVLPTNVTVNANVITTNAGGAGGAGGGGGAGGAGGNGGFGYLTGSNDFRSGGDGGRGGNGGNGGNGGGGGGGPSIGILVSGGTSTQTNNTLNVGAGGVGGAPFGVAGRSAGIVTLP